MARCNRSIFFLKDPKPYGSACSVSNSAVWGGITTQIKLSAGLVNDRSDFIPIPAF